ncbi:MAG: hypothetical protein AMXMBFR13_30650 [Phycisphaerae bacterium]
MAADREHVDAAVAPLVLTRDQVAAALQVSAETIEGLHRMGRLRGVRIGRHLRWRPGDVTAYVERLAPGE